MFFKLKIHEKTGGTIAFAPDFSVDYSALEYAEYIRSVFDSSLPAEGEILCRKVEFCRGFPTGIRKKIAEKTEFSDSDEAFAIVLDRVTKIYAAGERGFIYAASTLKQLAQAGELVRGFIYDYPLSGVRGYRVYLPARAGFEEFYRMVDFLAEYKYNSIILEIGGAMEYKRHPEINEKWAEFCREVHAYSGRAHEIQHKTYPWPKNSIHCDNAEGDILTQDECRALAAYCRSRGLDVIPECPTYSHCDYLVMAHPEIREREGDGYPDTYCANHPDTYKYVFDILEEVIGVFAPKMLNIGHDEMYTIGICPRCRKTPAYELYANDVKKLRDFLKERGVDTMMWGEKLLNARYIPGSGAPIGGAGHGKGEARVPALYPCRDLLPEDITFLHWYWRFNHNYDRVFHDRGYRMLFGNLNALNTEHWDMRRAWGMGGGFVSNWGSFKEEYMQRNLQYLALIGTAYAFWCDDFGSMDDEKKLTMALREAYRLKCAKARHPLFITHTTEYSMPYKSFYDGVFIVDEKYLLGHYLLRYTDGSEARLPVKYGTHIASDHFGDYLHETGLREASYSTMPRKYRDGIVYECVYENPHPEKKLAGIAYTPVDGRESIAVELIGFRVGSAGGDVSVTSAAAADAEFAWDGE